MLDTSDKVRGRRHEGQSGVGCAERRQPLEGRGHGTYGSSPCVREVADAYLVSLRVPPRGSRCPAVEPAG
ncbi:alpha/beta hydrolase [Streptomyces sp. NBC_01104]|uniref:alpha/beta hydrolase n=1 Tax=Streptomyces sp. NBC_01104 TaxID=2903750 RepID=UPI0038690351